MLWHEHSLARRKSVDESDFNVVISRFLTLTFLERMPRLSRTMRGGIDARICRDPRHAVDVHPDPDADLDPRQIDEVVQQEEDRLLPMKQFSLVSRPRRELAIDLRSAALGLVGASPNPLAEGCVSSNLPEH
jgi:hypothetical protein